MVIQVHLDRAALGKVPEHPVSNGVEDRVLEGLMVTGVPSPVSESHARHDDCFSDLERVAIGGDEDGDGIVGAAKAGVVASQADDCPPEADHRIRAVDRRNSVNEKAGHDTPWCAERTYHEKFSLKTV